MSRHAATQLLTQNSNSVTSDTVYLSYFQLHPRTVWCCVRNRIMLCKIFIFYCKNMLVLSCFSPDTLHILTFAQTRCSGLSSSCSALSSPHISHCQHGPYTAPSSGFLYFWTSPPTVLMLKHYISRTQSIPVFRLASPHQTCYNNN